MEIPKRYMDKYIIKHGDKFDYSKSVYVDAKTDIEIVCPIHGSMFQRPYEHTRSGCMKCKVPTQQEKENEFLKKAFNLYGYCYEYVDMGYTKYDESIRVTCLRHGVFETTPEKFLVNKKGGCPTCLFEAKAMMVGKGYYDFSKANYKSLEEKVTLICPYHGEFEILPKLLLSTAKRCPDCTFKNRFVIEHKSDITVYYVSVNNGESYVTGMTDQNISMMFTNKEIIKTWVYSSGFEAKDKLKSIKKKYKKLISDDKKTFTKDVLGLDK